MLIKKKQVLGGFITVWDFYCNNRIWLCWRSTSGITIKVI